MQTRIFFSDEPNTFFFLSDYYRYPDVENGDCVLASGPVKLDSYKTPFLEIGDIYGKEGLYACPPELQP